MFLGFGNVASNDKGHTPAVVAKGDGPTSNGQNESPELKMDGTRAERSEKKGKKEKKKGLDPARQL